MATMQAMVIDDFGGPERLHLADLPVPEPADGEVLIRVACAGVNPVDWKIREGMLRTLFPHQFPLIPGWDAAGTVAALGAEAKGFAVGDRVFAYCRKPFVQAGTYAQYVVVAADVVAPMPRSLGFASAASIPLAGLTAWQSLFDAAGLQRGQSVLVHAASGGVGSLAVQFAKHAGAEVVATASAANERYIRELGADVIIDYTRGDVTAAVRERYPEGVDVVYATVGGEVLRDSYHAVRRGGFVVSIVDPPLDAEAEQAGVRHAFVFVTPNGRQLREIGTLLDAGHVRAPAVTGMPLAEAARAQELSRAGHVRGKLVLTIP
jgi:NADPH2:quinone reductase